MERLDGTTKEDGFFGRLPHISGGVSTELSIGAEINGEEVLIPSLVPTLTKAEVMSLLTDGEITGSVVDKAVAHAEGRIKEGKSPFWTKGDEVFTSPLSKKEEAALKGNK